MNWWPDDDVKVALANYGSAYIELWGKQVSSALSVVSAAP
jgi:hypothetical protein